MVTVYSSQIGEKYLVSDLKTNFRESSEKSSEKILKELRNNGHVTILELSLKIGISTRAIEKQLDKLKQTGRITRTGPDNGGYWKVNSH